MCVAAYWYIEECVVHDTAHGCVWKGSRVLGVVQFDDQGIVNSDSRTIAVPHDYANFIPTDIRGTTFARTPAQVQFCKQVLTFGSAESCTFWSLCLDSMWM